MQRKFIAEHRSAADRRSNLRQASLLFIGLGLVAGCGSGSNGVSASGGTSSEGGVSGHAGVSTNGGASPSMAGAGGGSAGAGHVGGAGGSGIGGVAGTAGGDAFGGGGAFGAAGAPNNSGGQSGSAMGGNAGSAGGAAGGASGATRSAGCGKNPTLKNSGSGAANQNSITVSGTTRQFLIRWPDGYDNSHAYRLVLDFHGAGGKDTDLAPSYFGLFALANNSTIFVAPSAAGGFWNATSDTSFVDEILKAVESDLCIDTSRIELEGFSQGGAMVATLACARPGVFRAVVAHSRGGLDAPSSCQAIPYLGSLGLHDIAGNSQATQTDPFAKWNGCTIENLPTAPVGGHVCTSYKGCSAGDPTVWCSFDGPHTPSPTDAMQSMSWMPAEVWQFLAQF